MELINIYPIKNLEYYEKQSMNMFLTHLVEEDEAYRNMAINYNGYKILDNSLIELDGAMSMKDVLTAADIIGADEVVLPDVFKNGSETIKTTLEALGEYKEELKNYKTMAVVHGETIDEWVRTFLIFSARPDIDVLGIPKVMQEQFKSHGIPGRARILNKVISLTDKEIHLLGLWENFDELVHYQHHLTKIRSMDTSLPSLLEINHKTIFDGRSDCETQKIDLVNDIITNEGMTEGARKYVDRVVTIL